MSISPFDVVLGSDHAGVNLRRELAKHLQFRGLRIADWGPDGTRPVDYPDQAERVGRAVVQGEATFGILVCGSGIGVSIAANRIAGVRAARVTEPLSARLAREHNDANVLTFGERVTGVDLAKACVDAFLEARFDPGSDGRHLRRVRKLDPPGSSGT